MFRFVIAGLFLMISSHSAALTLHNTLYETVSLEVGIDPLLLYSVALAESAYRHNDTEIAPYPWTIRTDKALYFDNQTQAKIYLETALKRRKSIDVGLMQINVKWHGHRVKDPLTLLDPRTNLRIGAQILKESLRSSPHDLVTGIGRYHSFEQSSAVQYGRTVLLIYQDLVQQLEQ